MEYALFIYDPRGYFLKWYTIQGEEYASVTDKPEKTWKRKAYAEKALKKLNANDWTIKAEILMVKRSERNE